MRLLFIATQIPPYNGSGNIRILNYLNYLSMLGHKIDVVSVDYPKDSVAYDETLEDAFSENINIYRVNPGFLYKLFYRKKMVDSQNLNKKNSQNTSINSSFKGKVNSFIRQNFLLPDSFMQWIMYAFNKAKHLMRNKSYDIIVTIHETPSSHIVGYKLKKKFPNVRWVGYWSDPWNGDSLRENRMSIKSYIEEKIEKNIVDNIDKLLFTTNSTRDLYVQKYKINPNNTDVVYRGYDENLYNIIEKNTKKPTDLKKGKINIVHTGTIYKKLRDIEPLCEALLNLSKKEKEIFNRLHFIFIGQFDNKDDEMMLRQFENITIKPLLPYHQALEYVVQADVLLLYGNKNSTQVPGKVFEYIGSKAPILTILGDRNDELKFIMKQGEKGPVILNTKEEILSTLKCLFEMHESDTWKEEWKQPNVYYKWENIAKDLQEKILQ